MAIPRLHFFMPAQRTAYILYTFTAQTSEYIFLLEMKQGFCVCPLSWSVHCNFTGDGICNERGWACTPQPLPAWANFTLMMECTPESSRCYSVYSVLRQFQQFQPREKQRCYSFSIIKKIYIALVHRYWRFPYKNAPSKWTKQAINRYIK